MNKLDELVEAIDLEETLQQRKALIEEVKQIEVSSDWNTVSRQISDLRRKWKRFGLWQSAYEEQLEDEFETAIDALFSKRREEYRNAEEGKRDLIHQAKILMNSQEFATTTDKMNDLMQQWKALGSAGKETDDVLWDEFNTARQTFFDRKHENWQNRQDRFNNARQVKEDLVKQAEALKDSTEWQKTSGEFKALMETWKNAGSAGREHEDALWQAFQQARQTFFDQRSAYYDELHKKQDAHFIEKQKLVEAAKAVLAEGTFSREVTAKMKELSAKWKTIGSCGKENEDKVWAEFRATMDSYFNGLTAYNEQRHEQWRQRILDNRNRKLDLIAKQKRQIEWLQQEMVGMLSERAMEEAKLEIEDKKAFIEELEEQVADLNRTLEA